MKTIIQQLKVAKVTPDKKWLYNYTRCVLKRLDEGKLDYQWLQVRLAQAHLQSKGYYTEYYANMSKETKRKVVTAKLERQSTPELLDKRKKEERFNRKIIKMYKRGLLSDVSTKIIDGEFEKETIRQMDEDMK